MMQWLEGRELSHKQRMRSGAGGATRYVWTFAAVTTDEFNALNRESHKPRRAGVCGHLRAFAGLPHQTNAMVRVSG